LLLSVERVRKARLVGKVSEMKRLASGFVFTGLLAASSVAPAWAADMPLKAPPLISQSNWTGFYAGGEVGYGWGDRSGGFTPNDPAAALLFGGGPGFPGQQPVVNSVNVGRSGAVGGLEAGYNWQVGQSWVWGIEADISLSGLSGQASGTSVIQSPPLFLQTTTAQENNDWYGTFRGRLGWLATPNLLLFGTGGLAYGKTSESANYLFTGPAGGLNATTVGGFSFVCTSNATCFSGTASAIRVGWSAGGGAEWMFDQHWSAKIEYQMVDLGSDVIRVTASTVAVPGTALSSFNANFGRDEIQVVRVGANYHF
jgi:outer membrane immunogenic protein